MEKGVMGTLFQQIKPLENGNYEGVLKRPCPTPTKCWDFKHEFLIYAGKYRAKKGYVLAFQLYHINKTLGKRELRRCTKTSLSNPNPKYYT